MTLKSNTQLKIFGVALLALALAGATFAQDGPPSDAEAEMMRAMKEAAATGEHHKHLERLVGDWRAQIRIYTEPGAEPMEIEGRVHNEMVLDGRFLHSEYKGALMGEKFLGIGYDGYDTAAEKHVGLWIDSGATGMGFFEGSCDAEGKVQTMFAEFIDPMTGKTKKMKGVTKVKSHSMYTYEAWDVAEDGKTTKTMEIVFTKQ